MKIFKLLITILVIFFKTGNVLSENNLFSVNNIEISIDTSTNNKILANKAIIKGYKELIKKILLKEDIPKVNNLKIDEIKDLVSFYQISNEKNTLEDRIKIFNITFDKNKIHDLFYKLGISYSDIVKNEFIFITNFKKTINYIFTHKIIFIKIGTK